MYSLSNSFPAEPTKREAQSRLELVFKRNGEGATYLSRQYAEYPFHLCKLHYLDEAQPDMATLYLQSCSGGLFQNDSLTVNVTAAARTCAHITSQASTIVHSSRGGQPAITKVTLTVEQDALLEYVPDPMILFPESRLSSRIDLILNPAAIVMLTDAFITHDPEGKSRNPGRLDAVICVREHERFIVVDRLFVDGEYLCPGKPGVMGEWRCFGTFMILTRCIEAAQLSERLRVFLESCVQAYWGVSALPNDAGVLARFLSADAPSLRHAMEVAWRGARRITKGHDPSPRRK
jgi:urease accessory protein